LVELADERMVRLLHESDLANKTGTDVVVLKSGGRGHFNGDAELGGGVLAESDSRE
jgi:hypothetical protein